MSVPKSEPAPAGQSFSGALEDFMPDRILRDELWHSDRFLDLPTDACRLTFMRMLSEADDFGNLEGGVKRLFRMLTACTQIKSETATATTLEALIDADLIRAYEVDGRSLLHIPRFRSKRWYFARKVPASPWCDATIPLGKAERSTKQGLAPEVATTLSQRSTNVAQGVGVGVGEGVEKREESRKRSSPLNRPQEVAEQVWTDWLALRKAKKAPVTATVLEGAQKEANKAGMPLESFLRLWCARGSQGLQAAWLKADERHAVASAFEGMK